MATMAKPLSESLDASPEVARWCLLLLDQLEDLATLAWFLVADGKLVEETFSRTLAQLDTIPFDATAPLLARNLVRKILIAQAIAVLEASRREEEKNRIFDPSPLGDLPDLPRLAFMLRMVIRSSVTEVADFLGVMPCEARELVSHAISHLSAGMPSSLLTGSRET
jgi:DNA-directed RNA polymerase specialized sigma24 family protein